MSNMLYYLSILYKSKIPLQICFNKIDILDHSFALKWMTDYEAVEQSLSKVDNYLSSLSRSLSLVLDEFYKNVDACGVSANVGKGFDNLVVTFDKSREEYYNLRVIKRVKTIKKKRKRVNKSR